MGDLDIFMRVIAEEYHAWLPTFRVVAVSA